MNERSYVSRDADKRCAKMRESTDEAFEDLSLHRIVSPLCLRVYKKDDKET